MRRRLPVCDDIERIGMEGVVPEPVEVCISLSSPHNAQLSPHVERKPPAMELTGHHRLWSWLKPVFSVPDEELLRSSGLDALVREGEREGDGCLIIAIWAIVARLRARSPASPAHAHKSRMPRSRRASSGLG